MKETSNSKKSAVKPAAKTIAKPAAKSVVQSAVKAVAKAEPKAIAKPITKTIVKAEPKAIAKSVTSKSSSKEIKKKVVFEVNAEKGAEVYVAGTFNDWNPQQKQLEHKGDGVYTCALMLSPGTYEYKFRINSAWAIDQENPNFTRNDLGSLNSVLVVQ